MLHPPSISATTSCSLPRDTSVQYMTRLRDLSRRKRNGAVCVPTRGTHGCASSSPTEPAWAAYALAILLLRHGVRCVFFSSVVCCCLRFIVDMQCFPEDDVLRVRFMRPPICITSSSIVVRVAFPGTLAAAALLFCFFFFKYQRYRAVLHCSISSRGALRYRCLLYVAKLGEPIGPRDEYGNSHCQPFRHS